VVNTERRRRVDSEAKFISFDEMWTYVGCRRKGKRNSVWIWTAVVEEGDGSRWMDYEVGDRGEGTFLRCMSVFLMRSATEVTTAMCTGGCRVAFTRWARAAR